MNPQQQLGPFCQSCGMPLTKPEDFGTLESGIRNNDYCHYCYAAGKLINPDMTLEKMTEFCVDALVRQQKMPEPQARALMTDVLPRLKRWRKAPAARATARH